MPFEKVEFQGAPRFIGVSQLKQNDYGGGGGGLTSGFNSILGLAKTGFDAYSAVREMDRNDRATDANIESVKAANTDNFRTDVAAAGAAYAPLFDGSGVPVTSREEYITQQADALEEEAKKYNWDRSTLENFISSSMSTKNQAQSDVYNRQQALGQDMQLTDGPGYNMQGGSLNVTKPMDFPAPAESPVAVTPAGTPDPNQTPRASQVQVAEATQEQVAQEVAAGPTKEYVDTTEMSKAAGEPIDPMLMEDSPTAHEQKYNSALPELRTERHPAYDHAYLKALRQSAAYTRAISTTPIDSQAFAQVYNLADNAMGNAIEARLHATFKSIPERFKEYADPRKLQDVTIASYMTKNPFSPRVENIRKTLVDRARKNGATDPEKDAAAMMSQYYASFDDYIENGAYNIFADVISAGTKSIDEQWDAQEKMIVARMERDTKDKEASAKIMQAQADVYKTKAEANTADKDRPIKAAEVGAKIAEANAKTGALRLDNVKFQYTQIQDVTKAIEESDKTKVTLLANDTYKELSTYNSKETMNNLKSLQSSVTLLTSLVQLDSTRYNDWGGLKNGGAADPGLTSFVGAVIGETVDKLTPDVLLRARNTGTKMFESTFSGPNGLPTEFTIKGRDGEAKTYTFDPKKPKLFLRDYYQMMEDIGGRKEELQKRLKQLEDVYYAPEKKASIEKIVSLLPPGRQLNAAEFRTIVDSGKTTLVMEDFVRYKEATNGNTSA